MGAGHFAFLPDKKRAPFAELRGVGGAFHEAFELEEDPEQGIDQAHHSRAAGADQAPTYGRRAEVVRDHADRDQDDVADEDGEERQETE